MHPLSGDFPAPDGNVVILIDALDEATKNGCNELAELAASGFSKTPGWLRVILTSRPEPGVKLFLQGYSPFTLEADQPENVEDLKTYVTKELEKYTGNPRLLSSSLAAIVEKSDGLFL